MKFKDFYKFSWSKLVLFVLITEIPLFLIMYQMGIIDGPPINPFWTYLTFVLYWPFLLIYFLESLIIPNLDWIHLIDIPFILIAFVINVIYLYTISSLLVFLFGKIKAKK